MPYLDTGQLPVEAGLSAGAAIFRFGGAQGDIAIHGEGEPESILLTLVSNQTVRDQSDGSSVAVPGHSNMVPLSIGNWDVGRELKEDRGNLAVKEVDIHARVDGLQEDALVHGVVLRTEKIKITSIQLKKYAFSIKK